MPFSLQVGFCPLTYMSGNNTIQQFQGKGTGKYLWELDASPPSRSQRKRAQADCKIVYCTQDSHKEMAFLL